MGNVGKLYQCLIITGENKITIKESTEGRSCAASSLHQESVENFSPNRDIKEMLLE